jgi:hypothetical protein
LKAIASLSIVFVSVSERRLPPVTVRLFSRTVQSVGWSHRRPAFFILKKPSAPPRIPSSKRSYPTGVIEYCLPVDNFDFPGFMTNLAG